MACIFCKIASKEIKSELVRETPDLVVIKDINPQAPTHLLIFPKKHYETLLECDDQKLLGQMLTLARDIAREKGFDEAGFRCALNTNDEGGQTVFHMHMHVLAGRPLSGALG